MKNNLVKLFSFTIILMLAAVVFSCKNQDNLNPPECNSWDGCPHRTERWWKISPCYRFQHRLDRGNTFRCNLDRRNSSEWYGQCHGNLYLIAKSRPSPRSDC